MMWIKRYFTMRLAPIWIVAGVLVLILGWFTLNRALAPSRAVRVIELPAGEVKGDPTRQTLRIIAYNIAHGRGTGDSNWTDAATRHNHLDAIADFLKAQDADVVVLNEVDYSAVWSGHENQAERIARAAGYRYRAEQRNIDSAVPFAALRFGNAILSRYPIVEAYVIDLPGYAALETMLAGKKRAAACVIETEQGDRFRVVGAHLETRGDESFRVNSAKAILAGLKPPDMPTVIAGDLNSTLPGLPGARVTSDGTTGTSTLRDVAGYVASPTAPAGDQSHVYAPTFPSWEPERTIDWVWVKRPFLIESVHVPDSDLSDHLPVVVDIHLADDSRDDATID